MANLLFHEGQALKRFVQGALVLLWMLSSDPVLALNIQVQGLFKNTAVLVIDGRQRMLKAGARSPEGVLLVSADTHKAVVEIDGKRQVLSLSRQISTNYNPVSRPEVSIRRNQFNQYITRAEINGRRMQVLIDTGANNVAMNSNDARRLGIDYLGGEPAKVSTAGGVSSAYVVKLRSIEIGGITVHNIKGFVVDGNFPTTLLLGMSFLEHVNLREQNNILYLKGKY